MFLCNKLGKRTWGLGMRGRRYTPKKGKREKKRKKGDNRRCGL